MWKHADLLTLGTFVACLLFDVMVRELMHEEIGYNSNGIWNR